MKGNIYMFTFIYVYDKIYIDRDNRLYENLQAYDRELRFYNLC